MNTTTDHAAASNHLPPVAYPQTQSAGRPRPHPTCKIARLPTDVREMINQSMADNISNVEIITRLDAMGHPGITPMNLSRWAYTGYLVWLRHRERLDLLRIQSDANCDLVREVESSDPTACSRINNLFLAGQLAQLMDGMDLKSLKQQLQSDPANFFRLVRSVNAQTRNTFRQQRLQADLAKQQMTLSANEHRDSGQVQSTTSPAGYAAAAQFYGLPPRFSKQLPNSTGNISPDSENPNKTDKNITS